MSRKRTRSDVEWERARKVLPGGVNSPVRSFGAVPGDPIFLASGEGATVTDIDGNEFIDYVLSWGPLILGHRHPKVTEAIASVLETGTTFGAPTIAESELAERIVAHMPSIEMVRMVSSGTEATMSALRLARGVTGRDGVVKFDGCYHGHADALLVEAGSGAATLSIPGSAGVPARMVEATWSLPYNDSARFEKFMAERGDDVAAVIVEPVAGNMGVVPPADQFLQTLRRVTAERGALLIFDEVISGFRLGLGGAQARFGIEPDLTALGKIIGGGLPLGAYGGRKDLMERLAPSGEVYQAGTLSGNPAAVAAGIATIDTLSQEDPYASIEDSAKKLGEGLVAAANGAGVPAVLSREGSMFSIFFHDSPVSDYEGAKAADHQMFARYHGEMLNEGIYIAPSQYEAYFLSSAHTDSDYERTLSAAARVFERLARQN